MVSIEKVRNILKTLPIGYYLGRKITLTLDDSDKSYYDSFNDLINVGYQLLPCANDEYSITDEEAEQDIRCMLYHEISHVLATPDVMSHISYSGFKIKEDYESRFNALRRNKIHSILNIFEDERIETLFKHFFLHVNFKEYVKKVNHYEKWVEPKDTDMAFYQIVRFNDGPKQFVNQVFEIINNSKAILRFASEYESYQYFSQVINLYFEIEDYYKTKSSEEDDPEETTEESEIGTISNKKSGDGDSKEELDGEESSTCSVKVDLNATNSTKEGSELISEKELEKIINKIDNAIDEIKDKLKTRILSSGSDYLNKSLDKQVNEIILNAKRKKGLTASSHQSHYGRVNPKYVGRKRIEDYRWCDKSLSGEKAGSSKLQLNLFVDISGSFGGSEWKINELLYTLNQLQRKNKDFVCRLVTMGDKNTLQDKITTVRCCEGNYLLNEIIDIYKRCQGIGNTNYNIVVFDGDAQSFDYWGSTYANKMRLENEKAYSAWNHPNCVIISDPSNQDKFDKWAPAAKRIYTYSYVSKLEENIIKALKMLFK